MELDLDHFKARLLARRAELVADDESASESQKAVELDQTRVGRLSRMDAIQMQAVAKESGIRRHLEVGRIDAALRRIDEDEFGDCVRCGEEIALKRLELDPSLPNCIQCATEAENP
ncbi:TraR/DksA family transcriptional regulator [Magnetococcus sp. PR-3]|uniref:TraR/DksA family transcriptional regulator n=1 Tax=Magnetococcus sp. PR-3 TaxID=3120355 RepID=UPI002FCE3364